MVEMKYWPKLLEKLQKNTSQLLKKEIYKFEHSLTLALGMKHFARLYFLSLQTFLPNLAFHLTYFLLLFLLWGYFQESSQTVNHCPDEISRLLLEPQLHLHVVLPSTAAPQLLGTNDRKNYEKFHWIISPVLGKTNNQRKLTSKTSEMSQNSIAELNSFTLHLLLHLYAGRSLNPKK